MGSIRIHRPPATAEMDFHLNSPPSWTDGSRLAVHRTFFDRQIGSMAVRAGHICAVIMAADLGIAVLEVLPNKRVPIYTVGTWLWVFVVARPTSTDNEARQAVDLFKAAVTVAWPGATIALPTPGNDLRRWISDPNDTALPAFSALVDAVVEATSTRQGPTRS